MNMMSKTFLTPAVLVFCIGCGNTAFRGAFGSKDSSESRSSGSESGTRNNQDLDANGEEIVDVKKDEEASEERSSTELNCLGDTAPLTLIRTQAELSAIDQKAGNYRLANDIVLVGDWQPIYLIRSVFDGAGFAIRNVSISRAQLGGLFIGVQSSILRNLNVSDLNINHEPINNVETVGPSGGLAAGIENSTVENVHVSNGIIRGSFHIGALAGVIVSPTNRGCIRQDHTIIRNSSVSALELFSNERTLLLGTVAARREAGTETINFVATDIVTRPFSKTGPSTTTVPVTQESAD